MPEFEENPDTQKSAPYTYEPSKSTASELAGSVITPSNGSSQPTKSRWGKQDSKSSESIQELVPAGEVDLSNVDNISDSLSSKIAEVKVENVEKPRRRSRIKSEEDSSSEEQHDSEEEADKPKANRRSRSRTKSSSSKSASTAPKSTKPVEAEPTPEEPETIADKLVNWIRKLVVGGKIEQEPEPQPRGRSRNRSGSGGNRRRRSSRRSGSKNGESRQRSTKSTSSDGEKTGGQRRRRSSSGRSRKSSSS
jgi:hypothetical protein